MTHIDTLVAAATAGPPPSPGFLLTPFGWAAEPLAAMVHAEPSLLADLFAISRPRMHLIALAMAHLEPPIPSAVASLLARWPTKQVLDRAVGHSPAGIKLVPDAVQRTVEHRPRPGPAFRGIERVDDRRVISGIVHVLKSGCRWCDCPPDYGPPTTIYNALCAGRR